MLTEPSKHLTYSWILYSQKMMGGKFGNRKDFCEGEMEDIHVED